MKGAKKKSKKKSLNVIIPLVVYPFDVMLSVGQTDEELMVNLKKHGVEWDDDIKLAPNGEGRTLMNDNNQTILRLRRSPVTADDYGTLQHEIFHVVTFILTKIGIKLCRQSDEAFAYLIGYLTTEIYRRI